MVILAIAISLLPQSLIFISIWQGILTFTSCVMLTFCVFQNELRCDDLKCYQHVNISHSTDVTLKGTSHDIMFQISPFFHTSWYFCIFTDPSYVLSCIPKQTCRNNIFSAKESNIFSLNLFFAGHKLIHYKSCKSGLLNLIGVLDHF